MRDDERVDVGSTDPKVTISLAPIHAEEGTTYTPWTNGWAVGFKVTAEGKPDRWVFLNPSQSDSLDDSNVFVYLDEHEPTVHEPPVESVCYVTIWPGDDEPLPATVANMRRAIAAGLHPIAYSPSTRERNSADPGDYFTLGDDEPLTDANNDAMILVTQAPAQLRPIISDDLDVTIHPAVGD